MKYDKNIFIDKLTVNFPTISLNKKIIKPIEIDKNNTLKKFSFLWNLLVNPNMINESITIKKGFSNSDR